MVIYYEVDYTIKLIWIDQRLRWIQSPLIAVPARMKSTVTRIHESDSGVCTLYTLDQKKKVDRQSQVYIKISSYQSCPSQSKQGCIL